MPTTVYGTFQTQLGVALETTPGTPAASPVMWLPVAPPKQTPQIKYFTDSALRGVAADDFGDYAMGGYQESQYTGPFFPDSGGYFPLAVFGTDTVTAAPTATTLSSATTIGATSAPVTSATGYVAGMAVLIGGEGNIILSVASNTLTLLSPLRLAHASGAAVSGNSLHTMTLANQPKTATFWDYFGVAWQQYAYCTSTGFNLKWTAEAECTHTSTYIGLLGTTPSAPGSESYTQVPPFIGWQSGVAIAGTAKTNMESFEIDFKRTAKPVFAAANQQSPVAIFAGVLQATAKATFRMQDMTEYDLFIQGLVEKTQVGIFGPALGDQRATPAATGLFWTATDPTATAAVIDRSNEWVECQVNWRVAYNATDAGPSQLQLTNSVTAYT